MEKRMEAIDFEAKDEALKSPAAAAIRCAKAAVLLSSLQQNSPIRRLAAINNRQNEEARLRRDVEDLKRELAMERWKNKKLKMCALTELNLQIAFLLFFLTLCSMIAFNFL